MNKHAPEQNVKIPHNNIIREPWMSLGILKFAKTRDKLHFICMKSGPNTERTEKFNKYCNTYNALKRIAKQSYYCSFAGLCRRARHSRSSAALADHRRRSLT